MNGKSLKAQYRDCYRLERLIEQSYAMFDLAVANELRQEMDNYPSPVQRAASQSFFSSIDALSEHGYIVKTDLRAWQAMYRRKEGL